MVDSMVVSQDIAWPYHAISRASIELIVVELNPVKFPQRKYGSQGHKN